MSHARSQPGLQHAPFWAIFQRSRIPMSLIDRDRRYVETNDATLELYGYTREQMIGNLAGFTMIDPDDSETEALWQQALATNELYGERLIAHASGAQLRVTFAGHGTIVADQWFCLIVVLSAHAEPDGPELIGASEFESPNGEALHLTDREREVVHHVALGAGTRQIAADLHVSPETVRSHVRNAMNKTDSHTRAQLVAIALAEGLIAE